MLGPFLTGRSLLTTTAQGLSRKQRISPSLCFSCSRPLQTLHGGLTELPNRRNSAFAVHLQWLPLAFKIKASAGEPTRKHSGNSCWELMMPSN